MASEPQEPGQILDPPEGMYPTRVDEKGRLKLPEDFRAFLATLEERKFFVTTLDESIGRIYPITLWREEKKLLEDANDEAADRVRKLAAFYGAVAEIDSQGRVLLSPSLRRQLGLENQPAMVEYSKGQVHITPQQHVDGDLEAARANRPGDMKRLRALGLKL